jgi:DNA invertase Pin-like site-specific DNA recombinase
MTRSLLTSLLLVTLLGAVAVPIVGAQGTGDGPQGGQGPPTELWDEFPLKQPAPESGVQDRQSTAPAPGGASQDEADDGSSGAIPILLAGLVALAVLGVAVWAGIRARRRRSRAAPTGVPAPTAPAGPVQPATARDLPRPAPRAPPAPTAKPAAAPKAPPAPAAKPAPKAPPGPKPSKPVPERQAPDRTEKPDGRPAAVPIPVAARPQDGAASADAPEPSRRPGVGDQRAVGYASVSAADDLNNAELKVQVRLIQEACQRRGLTLVKVVRDVESHASSDLRRPGLTYALERLAARDASCLVVSSIERLTRTAANLGALLGWLTECDARLVVIDLDLDTGTEEGQLGARALATVGGLERRKLEERTRKGLEAARNMRRSGRPAVSDRPSLKQRIADMRSAGMTLQAIADTLNAEGVPTLRGGAEWRPSSVQAAAGYKRPRRKGVLQGPAPPRDKRA